MSKESVRAIARAVVLAGSGLVGLAACGPGKPPVATLSASDSWCPDGFEVGPQDTCFAVPEMTTKDTPVIIISAMNDDEMKRRAAAVGANAFYDKPFSPLALLKEIEAFARKSEAAMKAALPPSES